ncbi:ashwin [Aulostomus maculatus]
MATSSKKDSKGVCASDVDLLLHPELLSQDYLKVILTERKVSTRDCGSRDQLTELFVRHVIPLPQRTLPNNRWGKKMEKSHGRRTPAGHQSDRNHSSSSHLGSIKLKKPEGTMMSAGVTDRLKPPPGANLSNPIRRLSSNTSSSPSSIQTSARSSDTASLKREANSSGVLKSPEVKKKIQHVTWP